jgi:hypothetical protein
LRKDTSPKQELGRGANNETRKAALKVTNGPPKVQEPQPVVPTRDEKALGKSPVAEPRASQVSESPKRVELSSRKEDKSRKESPSDSHRQQKAFVDTYDLPASYGTTNLTLIPRDPHWIHAYWEIAPSSLEAIRNRIGTEFERFKFALRMHDVTAVDFNGSNANQTFDIDVNPHANNWYINLWCDHVTYCGEIGLRSPRGEFVSLAQSNFASTPRASQSDRYEEIWMEVTDGLRRSRPFVTGKAYKERADAEKAEAEKARDAASKAHQGKAVRLKKDTPVEKIQRIGKRILLTDDDIKAYYSRLSPLLGEIIAERLARARQDGDKKVGAADARSTRTYRLYLKDGDVILDNANALIRTVPHGQLLKKILVAGSSAEFVVQGASESVGGGASERKAPAPRDKKRKFFFEIGTELIVYGRTEPDAEVWLGDKKIALRTDGTFSLRFALPDGKIPLDFVSISNDKVDSRRITTAVERFKTMYSP